MSDEGQECPSHFPLAQDDVLKDLLCDQQSKTRGYVHPVYSLLGTPKLNPAFVKVLTFIFFFQTVLEKC